MKNSKNIEVKSFMDSSYDDILIKALTECNDTFMEELPNVVEGHHFSHKFSKKMSRLIRTEKSFGGKRWMEACVRYTGCVIAAIVCFIVVNVLSISAFDLNLWNLIVDNTGEMINIKFENSNEKNTSVIKESESNEDEKGSFKASHYKIGSIPVGYELQEHYVSDELVVEILKSANGTITYTESPITETANINMSKGKIETEVIGVKEVTLIFGKENITAFFTDAKYYHIVEMQGKNVDKNTIIQIIKNLEEQ